MQETTNYKLKKPEGTDPVNVADFNENADVIDLELSKRVESAGGDISDTKIGAADTAAQEFPVPAPGDTARGFLGKMRKFCSDFNSFKTGVITLGKLVNNGLTTEEGYALDARYGKTLLDMVTRLNSDLGGLNSNFGSEAFRVLVKTISSADKENDSSLKITLADFNGVPKAWNYIIGFTGGLDGTVVGNLSGSGNYGGQLLIADSGILKYRRLASGVYGDWNSIITKTDFTIITNVQLTANQAIKIPGAPTQRCLTTVTGERDVHNFDYSIHQDNNREWWIWSNVSQAIDIGFLAIK